MSNDNIDAIVESVIKKYANISSLSDEEYLITIMDSIDFFDVVFDLEDTLKIEINETPMKKIYNNMKIGELKAFCKRLKENSENDK